VEKETKLLHCLVNSCLCRIRNRVFGTSDILNAEGFYRPEGRRNYSAK